jgi:hypothetical protein
MKAKPIYAILLLLIFSGCMNESRFLVDYDYSYKGNFKKYSSFTFVDNMPFDESDSSMNNPIIKEAIQHQLEVHGYRMTKKKPSLLVSYKVFYDDLKFQGFVQPEIENWIQSETEDVGYDPVKYNLVKGTLIIQLLEAKRHQTIWQGYASGVFNDKTLSSERYLKRAVRSIFDKYRMFAEGYIIESRNDHATPVGNADR